MLLLALLACGPPAVPGGAPEATYTLRRWSGEVVGQDTLGRAGSLRVEHGLAGGLDGEDLAIEAELWPDGSWRGVVRLGARWQEQALSVSPARWSLWRGLARAGGALDGAPEALARGYAADLAPGAEASLLAWEGLLHHAEGSFEAVDPRTGRRLPVRLEQRERRSLTVGGAAVEARRLYAWSGIWGASAWVDASGRILTLRGLGGALTAELEGAELPADPAPPLPAGIREEPVSVARPELRLAGLRDAPEAGATRGTVLLLHGSGPGDRDGSYGPVRAGVFRDLGRALAARGYAVLRYDKRGVGESMGPDGKAPASSTLDDLIADAAAVQGLAGPCQFLVGHSEGAYIAVERALADPRVRGVVLLGGPARRLDHVMAEQLPRVYAAEGASEAEIALAARQQRASLAAVRAGRDRDVPGLEGQRVTTAWLASHLDHDQEQALARLRTPLLALYGAEDMQVPPDEEGVRMREIAQTAGAPDLQVQVLPGLDHLMMLARAPIGLGAYYDPDRRLAPDVIEAVGRWLDAHPCPESGG